LFSHIYAKVRVVCVEGAEKGAYVAVLLFATGVERFAELSHRQYTCGVGSERASTKTAELLEKAVLPTVNDVKALLFVLEILPAAVPTYKCTVVELKKVEAVAKTKQPSIVLPFKKPVAVVGLNP
jgi:hypothetical protein